MDITDNRGWTPLMIGASKGHENLCSKLVNKARRLVRPGKTDFEKKSTAKKRKR